MSKTMNNSIVDSGWIEKYNKGLYRTRWFVLREDGSFTWYRSDEHSTARDTIYVKNGLRILKGFEGDCKIIVIKTEKQGDNCWYLRMSCPKYRERWVNTIEVVASKDGNGIIEIDTERFKTESSFKYLEPKLAFQADLPAKVLETAVEKGVSLNDQMMKSLKIASTALDFVAPGAGLIMNVLSSVELLIVEGPSAFTFFRSQDLTQDSINGKIIEHILLNELVTLQAEIGTLETRYKHIRNPNLSVDDYKPELITSLNTCEKYIRKFLHPESVFYKHPMVTSPYLVQFALLFVNISSIAKALLLHYQETIKGYMLDLISCLEQYKEKVLKIRLDAIRGNFEYTIKSPWDKVIDEMYPSNTGGFYTREAYAKSPLTRDLDSGKKFLTHYKENVKTIYFEHFERVIFQAKELSHSLNLTKEFIDETVNLANNPVKYGWVFS